MTFNTRPKIDFNAERSEESVLEVRKHFSMKSGFIAREVNGSQDYGVDIYVELTDTSGALGASFPIQIKSTKKRQTIIKKNEEYICLKFLTSRLGYLCSHGPYYGLIIYYDEYSKELYFDYVWDICSKLTSVKDDDLWKSQETVIIHIPKRNILSDESLKKIKETFITIYLNHQRLIKEKGTEYGIHSFDKIGKIQQANHIDKKQNIRYLEVHGNELINEYKFQEIIQRVENLQYKDIRDNPRILYLAAISYTEIGLYIDADVFFTKCKKIRDSFNDGLWEILEIERFKLDYGLGRYNADEGLVKLLALRQNIQDPNNIAFIEQQINQIQLVNHIGDREFGEIEIEKIVKLFKIIDDKTESEVQKYFQKVYLSENLLSATTRVYADFINDERLYEDIQPCPSSRTDLLNFLIARFEFIVNINNTALTFAFNINNKLLEAESKHNISKTYFAMYLSLLINKKKVRNVDEFRNVMGKSIKYAMDSYNILLELSMQRLAYLALRTAYDIHRLTKELIDEDVNDIADIKTIQQCLLGFSNYDFYDMYDSTIDYYCSTFNEKEDTDNPLIGKSDDDIEYFTKRLIQARGLPKERIVNLKSEMISYRTFSKCCKNQDLILLTNQKGMNAKDLWSLPSRYQIVSNSSKIMYAEGTDISKMLLSIGINTE